MAPAVLFFLYEVFFLVSRQVSAGGASEPRQTFAGPSSVGGHGARGLVFCATSAEAETTLAPVIDRREYGGENINKAASDWSKITIRTTRGLL